MAQFTYTGPAGVEWPHLSAVIPGGAPEPGESYDLDPDLARPDSVWDKPKPEAKEK